MMLEPLTEAQMRVAMEARVEARGGVTRFAEAVGVTHAEVSQILHGHRRMTRRVAQGLGYQRATVFVPLHAAAREQGK